MRGATTLVTGVPRPLAASDTGTPRRGNVPVTSITGRPPAATVTTGHPMLFSYLSAVVAVAAVTAHIAASS